MQGATYWWFRRRRLKCLKLLFSPHKEKYIGDATMTYCTRPTYITNMYVTLRLNQMHNAVAMLQTYNRNRPWANPRPLSPTLGILWDQFFLKPMTLIYQTCESAKQNPLIKRMAAIFQNGRQKIDATLISAKCM